MLLQGLQQEQGVTGIVGLEPTDSALVARVGIVGQDRGALQGRGGFCKTAAFMAGGAQ